MRPYERLISATTDEGSRNKNAARPFFHETHGLIAPRFIAIASVVNCSPVIEPSRHAALTTVEKHVGTTTCSLMTETATVATGYGRDIEPTIATAPPDGMGGDPTDIVDARHLPRPSLPDEDDSQSSAETRIRDHRDPLPTTGGTTLPRVARDPLPGASARPLPGMPPPGPAPRSPATARSRPVPSGPPATSPARACGPR
jgi:hypothetical protein